MINVIVNILIGAGAIIGIGILWIVAWMLMDLLWPYGLYFLFFIGFILCSYYFGDYILKKKPDTGGGPPHGKKL